jgi:hypothetical protein
LISLPRFGRAQFERYLRYPSQRLLVLRFFLGFMLGLAALGGLGYVIGHGPSGEPGGVLHAVTTAAERPAVSAVLSVPPLMFCAWCLRRLWLQYLAWLPGTIQVPDFACEIDLKGAAPAQLTTQFRNRLATLRLQSAAPAPGALPPSNFLDVLGGGATPNGSAEGNYLTQAARLLRTVFPATALVVSGTLVECDHPVERFGVSLQVTRLPDQGSLLDDVWDTSWERAIRRAADGAIAAILPRTRLCKGPWETWRGYVMAPALFSAYEDTSHLDAERCFYPALESCYRALKHDPLNRAVRLQLGKLQEQLGLFLEALGTYQSILMASRPAGRPVPRRLYRRRARFERARMAHIARYRQIVLLGGNSIVEQLERLGKASQEDPHRQSAEKLLLDVCGRSLDLELATNNELRRALCASAHQKATGLERALRWWLGWWRLTHPRRAPHLLPRTVAVADACITERLKILKRGSATAPDIDTRIEEMDKRIRRCARFTGLRSWQSHYNAACFYALPLNDEYEDDESEQDNSARSRLAQRAVEQLTLAASFADSAFLASRRDWLISEDPDLTGLRSEPEFVDFCSIYFPTPEAAPRRSAKADEIAALYTHDLLCSIATSWATTWRQRCQVSKRYGPHDLSDWWRDEVEVWTLIKNLAAHPKDWDWREHLRLVRAKQSWDKRYPVKFTEPQFQRYAPEKNEIESIDLRLRSLTEILHTGIPSNRNGDTGGDGDGHHPVVGTAGQHQTWLEDREYSPADQHITKLCRGHATLWDRLDTFLGIDSPEGEDRATGLSQALSHTRRLEPWFKTLTPIQSVAVERSALHRMAQLWRGNYNRQA